DSKQSLANGLLDRVVRATVFLQGLPHDADETPRASFSQPDAPMHGRRTEIDQDSPRTEHPMRLTEGMDHAPGRHSSERPGENDPAERGRGVGKRLSLAYPIGDQLGVASWKAAPASSDLPPVRVHRVDHGRSERGQPQGEATVAAADLDHATA